MDRGGGSGQDARMHRRLPAALVAALVLLGVTAACDSSSTSAVLLVGDDNTLLAAPPLQTQIVDRDDGGLPVFNALRGYGICRSSQSPDTYWRNRLASIGSKLSPEATVVELGTVDLSSGSCL